MPFERPQPEAHQSKPEVYQGESLSEIVGRYQNAEEIREEWRQASPETEKVDVDALAELRDELLTKLGASNSSGEPVVAEDEKYRVEFAIDNDIKGHHLLNIRTKGNEGETIGEMNVTTDDAGSLLYHREVGSRFRGQGIATMMLQAHEAYLQFLVLLKKSYAVQSSWT